MARAKVVFGMTPELIDLLSGADSEILAQAAEAGGRAAAVHWHKNILKLHFEEFSPARYPGVYRDLTVKYKRRKHNSRPMFFTGKMLATLQGSASIVTQKQKNKVVAILRLPNARSMNFWRGGGRKHDFPKYVSAFNATDVRAVARVAQEAAAEFVKRKLESSSRIVPLSTHTG